MKINLASILIERDTVTKIPKHVWPWEVPIYRLQYGDEKVEILGDKSEVEVDELPDALEEYTRLRLQFGIEPDTKQSFADIAYGRGQSGVDALEKAIKASKGKDVKAGIEGAQREVDGGKPDRERTERREAAYKGEESADDAFTHASNNDIIGAAAGGPGDVSGQEPDAASVRAQPVRIVADDTKASGTQASSGKTK